MVLSFLHVTVNADIEPSAMSKHIHAGTDRACRLQVWVGIIGGDWKVFDGGWWEGVTAWLVASVAW